MRNRDLPDGGNLPERLRRFADVVAEDSPLYSTLSRAAAEDPVALDILAAAPSTLPAANILLAAVHYLLLSGYRSPLASHYQSVVGPEVEPAGDPVPLFHDFCADHFDLLVELVATRGVQTNEVRRCATLLPAFATVALADPRPLALIEIGPSAGLNLLFDRYRYDYGPAGAAGPEDSPLILTCEIRQGAPPIPRPLPEVAQRVGVDLHPLDLRDRDAVQWARALVWPEQLDRIARLESAIAIAREDPPPLIAWDAVDLLPSLLEQVPTTAVPVVFHSYVLNQFDDQARERLEEILRADSTRETIHRIGIEFPRPEGDLPEIAHTIYSGGEPSTKLLGTAHFHGAWLRWIG